MKFLAKCLFIFVFLNVCISCQKDPKCGQDFDYEAALDREENAWIDAQVEFFFDQSTENCETYRAAIEDYINEANKIKDCAEEVGDGDDLQDEIDYAQDELDMLSC